MADGTHIEWAEASWNVVSGCERVSSGCLNCYALHMARRLATMPQSKVKYAGLTMVHDNGKADWSGVVRVNENELDTPLSWRKPRRIFVNSMSDTFHEAVPDTFLDEMFGIMLACATLENRRHTFLLLTKRPERMQAYLTARSPRELVQAWAEAGNGYVQMDNPDVYFSEYVAGICAARWDAEGRAQTMPEVWSCPENVFPLPNVWVGTSVEDQRAADERIPHLLKIPAAVRFLSCEPLLGPVDLWHYDEDEGAMRGPGVIVSGGMTPSTPDFPPEGYDDSQPGIDWVIVGGESGPGARACNLEWIHSLVRQCRDAAVPVFVKQLGAVSTVDYEQWRTEGECTGISRMLDYRKAKRAGEGREALLLRNPKGGDQNEFPDELRVREFPQVGGQARL